MSHDDQPERRVFDAYGFPPYPGATPLCGQRVYAVEGPHITWDALVSAAAPQVVIAHYRAVLGDSGFAPDAEGAIWRVPAVQPQRVLDVRPVGAAGPHRRCAPPPPPAAQTVIIVSRRG